MTRTEVVVVGGGVGGLCAAYGLAQRGVPFLLLEAAGRWGGLVRTEFTDGFLVEGGPDSLLAQKPEGLELCRELGLQGRLVPSNPAQRRVYILHGGRLHAMPEGGVLGVPTRLLPLLETTLLTWPGRLRMALDLVLPRRRGGSDESIASFFRRRFGREALERLGEPLLAGIHAGEGERLSLPANFPRLAALEERHRSLILGLRRSSDGGARGASFYSLGGGLEELVQALVARLPAASLRLKAAVTAVVREAEGFRVQAEGVEATARAVVLALPAARAAALLETFAPEAATLLAEIPFASTASVVLGYRREQVEHPLDGHGLLVARREGLRTTACTFASTKFPGRAPEGHLLLRAFLGGRRDPAVLDLENAALSALVQGEMGRVLGLQGRPVLERVYRWPQATPQMEVGHAAKMARLERSLAVVPGLFVTGAGLRATGLPDTIGDGLRSGAAAAQFSSTLKPVVQGLG